ncbi:hypothetical protein [Rhodococcus sp. PSBB049]|uniref:hypothetical protein n=1 Tax=Rhodococcus sp. PSBB049 TaxID=2812863 RepID=UPI001980EA97|nr:hypothetical protein [Rhodococcus sp. PSBB049]QSE72472.1 hypothetical protein JYA91_29590 [Rhodococcus sp. PSBB049]
MTTQDPYPESTERAGEAAPSREGAGSSVHRTGSTTGDTGVPTGDTGVPTGDTGVPTRDTEVPTEETGVSTRDTEVPRGNTGLSTAETVAGTEDTRTLTGDVGTPTAHAETTSSQTESESRQELFAADELSGLRSRWDEVQAGFVDDPRDCVRKADTLVSDVVERLTSGFADARSRLEEQWARGDEASTEDLRLALKRYREFFQRLLSI